MKTSWTEKNPGHRIGKCTLNACRDWSWLDKEEVPKHTKKLVNLSIETYCEIAIEMKRLELTNFELEMGHSRFRDI